MALPKKEELTESESEAEPVVKEERAGGSLERVKEVDGAQLSEAEEQQVGENLVRVKVKIEEDYEELGLQCKEELETAEDLIEQRLQTLRQQWRQEQDKIDLEEGPQRGRERQKMEQELREAQEKWLVHWRRKPFPKWVEMEGRVRKNVGEGV